MGPSWPTPRMKPLFISFDTYWEMVEKRPLHLQLVKHLFDARVQRPEGFYFGLTASSLKHLEFR